ncbi:hypothetical protein A5645_05545 [Mycobacterium asiaticum]|uniref:hypothetical protein n=1 Tax=Mycobacterium asiaticum TaxID=1790 RepID=UPI0007EF03F6|nr:hypothetical protein [Mycobacterium asiaticum]OBK97740.1 hypothetical protein A5645_05545 [Mycobacterium asiaticum]
MSTLTNSQAEVVTAAMSVAKDAAEGRLAPSDLEHQALAELRQLFATVVGEGDPAWALHCDVARQVLALSGIPADELSEWLAVERQRAGDSPPASEAAETMPEPVQLASVAHRPEAVAADAGPEPAAEVAPEPVADTKFDNGPQTARPERYDPLRGWDAGGSRR